MTYEDPELTTLKAAGVFPADFEYVHPMLRAAASLQACRPVVENNQELDLIAQELSASLPDEFINQGEDTAGILAAQSRILDALFNRLIQQKIKPSTAIEGDDLRMILTIQRQCAHAVNSLKYHGAAARRIKNSHIQSKGGLK